MKSSAGKMLVAAGVLVFLGAAVWHFFIRSPEEPDRQTPAILQRRNDPAPQGFSGGPARSPDTRRGALRTDKEREESNPLQVPAEKIAEYLKLHNRDAASLLAAFHASLDPDDQNAGLDYLKEAATNFATDPQVQWTVLAHDVFPEDRRKWLDAFKESSPSNSLANYLSAENYFKNKQPDAAIKELLEASGKAQFADFTMEALAGGESLVRFNGGTDDMSMTAGMSAMAADLLPELSGMKRIANGILDVQKEYSGSGDKTSVENLSRMGLVLSDRLTSGDGGRFLISQLVGQAMENIALKSLEQNTSYDFLGGKTPAQRLEELKQQKQEFRRLAGAMGSVFYALPVTEQKNYFEKIKTDGELAAMRWLRQAHPDLVPQPAP